MHCLTLTSACPMLSSKMLVMSGLTELCSEGQKLEKLIMYWSEWFLFFFFFECRISEVTLRKERLKFLDPFHIQLINTALSGPINRSGLSHYIYSSCSLLGFVHMCNRSWIQSSEVQPLGCSLKSCKNREKSKIYSWSHFSCLWL